MTEATHIIDSARRLAIAEHAKHRHGDLPYSYHLTAVTGLVSCFTLDANVIAAAWLHDIVEDCPDIDLDVVEHMTNRRVRDIVDLLTDPEGPRALVKPISLARIASDEDAVLVKLADRYHNQASTLIGRRVRFAKLYSNELNSFLDAFLSYHHMPLYDMVRAQGYDLANLAHK